MITHERFNELYIEASAIFDAKVEQVPLLEVLELADSEYNPHYLIDTLGYFNCSEPNKVFLCNNHIKKCAEVKELDENILAEIIAIHQISHYIHFNLNSSFCSSNGKSRNNFRLLFIELFAQLLTEKFCLKMKGNYASSFEKLMEGHTPMYLFHNIHLNKINGSLKQFPKSILEIVFFKTDINVFESLEVLNHGITYDNLIISLFEEQISVFCKTIDDTKFKSNEISKNNIERLRYLGIADEPDLSSLDSSYYFIS